MLARFADWVAARALRLGTAATLLGALVALGQVPFGWVAPSFLALAVLLALFQTVTTSRTAATPRQAMILGWLAGTGYFAVALNWIVEPFLIEPELYGWLAPFGLFGLSGGLALFWALAFWGAARLGGGAMRLALALAVVELARGYVLTGFPWALIGYIWIDSAFAQWAAWIGPYGLTALTLAMAALPVWLWHRLQVTLPLLGAARVFGLTLGLGTVLWYAGLTQATSHDATGSAPDAPVLRLIQPNAPQDQKWDPEMIPVFFNRMVDYSAAAPKPDLVIWPESAVPVLLNEGAETLGYISEAAEATPLLLGIQRSEGSDFYNSAAYVDENGAVTAVYDKFHLVPFGEFMPFPGFWQRLGITGLAARVEAGYSAGPGPRTLNLGAVKALVLICYEAVFPQYARHPPRPDVLIQLTNDAWFGANSGPYQHLAQARMRAIETGLPMVRVANTGVSAVIDAKGKIIDFLPLNTAGYLDAPLPPALGATPYARSGDLPLTLLLLVLVLSQIMLQRRNSD
ncbi:apolipoprotein N-acyltransferase [Marinovum sp. 2_MG-2023]|uniref:apolipoprotein N-acyltransferase n=1 Tax=unclassified Marinovum TaxID=2647166 RepID=UPI0026E2C167|nr:MULTISPECIES: apolipoprotein N-acyltransferase [unclassified Marinovum]MDO6729992.1 apolipoprotein N-acyltransferase [Marinovum sp. 2_MG-2023]MDO6779806.1 apolipoprotein N-acyltransferase [Marinovum sp. 1_MG-2023]